MKNKFFYFAILPALFFQVVGGYLYFVAFENTGFAQTMYFLTKVLLVVWPLLWLWFIREKFRPFFGEKLKGSLILGFGSGALIVVLALGLYFLLADFLAQFSQNIISAAEGLDFLTHYLLFSFFLSIIHSFIEEYYWRWFVLKGLMLKMGKLAAVTLASLAFASHHFIVVMQFVPLYLTIIATGVIFLLGLLWSYLYLRTKSIIGSWVSHFFADAVIMTIGYFLIF